MSIEQDIYDANLNDPSEIAVLRMLLEQGTITLDDVTNAMTKKKVAYVKQKHNYDIYVDSRGRWRTYYKEPDDPSSKRRTISKKTEEEVYETLYGLYAHTDERVRRGLITIEELKDEWLEYKRNHGISEATILKYESDWRCHLEGTPIVRKPIRSLKKLDLDKWAHKLISDNNMTRKDYINVATLIRQPLDYAVELEIIDSNPMSKVKIESRMFKPVRKKKSETQVFTREELIRLQQIAWDDLDNKSLRYKLTPLAFLFMFQTGLRIGEVCAIKYEDIEGDVIHLQRSVERDCHKIKDGLKGVNTERWVPLSDEAMRIIEAARKRQKALGVSDSGYVFSTDDNYLSYRSLSSAFIRYCEKAGIEYRSSHKARKTFISSLIDAGMNINTIREWVGHAEEQTTWGSYCYDRRTTDERREILESALSS